MYDATDEELIRRILPVLEIDHQYARQVEAWDQGLISQVRRCSRAAARRLGYGVRTFQSDPDNRGTVGSSSSWWSPGRPPTRRSASGSGATC
jgi:hypothetical protein